MRPKRALRTGRQRIGEARELGSEAQVFADAATVEQHIEGARSLGVRAVGRWGTHGGEHCCWKIAHHRQGFRDVWIAVSAAMLANASVTSVAGNLGVSARHLRRVFRETLGVSPKTFAKLTRFQRALRAARQDGHASWANIAADSGYYDQAHLIAEFRTLTCVTPQVLLDELRAQAYES